MSNGLVAAVLVGFGAGVFAYPFFKVKTEKQLRMDKPTALPPNAQMRGPYMNAGSKDVGPVPAGFSSDPAYSNPNQKSPPEQR